MKVQRTKSCRPEEHLWQTGPVILEKNESKENYPISFIKET
jgi:hypothetical protein